MITSSPFVCSEYNISANLHLAVIDFEHLNGTIKEVLDNNFVLICEGRSCSSLSTVKQQVNTLYTGKNETWIMGATAEFFIHLYISLSGFKQECLFLNLEEGSIKKGFDGYYSYNGNEWLMESKAGSILTKDNTHVNKVEKAMEDLEDKVMGRVCPGKSGVPNNPWKNAYSHASHYDVGASEKIRKNIKTLSDDFINGIFYSIEKFNTMPCGTLFLTGIWDPPQHKDILEELKDVTDKLKGKDIYVICVTHKSVDLFLDYLKQDLK